MVLEGLLTILKESFRKDTPMSLGVLPNLSTPMALKAVAIQG
jgi:hypothetical protein